MRKCHLRKCAVLIEEHPTIHRLIEPFVKVDRERIGLSQPAKLLGHYECRRHPVRAIHVQPQSMFAAEYRDFLQRVDGARIDSSGGSDNRNQLAPRGAVALPCSMATASVAE